MGLQATLVVIALLFAHFVADFMCQTHWMATNKSKNWTALTTHVLVYSCGMWAAATIYECFVLRRGAGASLAFLLVTFATHFATDAVTSRITAKLWAAQRVHDFFVVVGLDQWIHATTLIVTARWLGLL